MTIMIRRALKIIVGKLIQFVESFENNESIDGKFVKNSDINTKVLSDVGFIDAIKIHETIPYQVYIIKFYDGGQLECADLHKVFDVDYNEVYIKDLKEHDRIIGYKGLRIVKSVEKMPYKLKMYDLEVVDKHHRYYTDGVLSHNTTSICSYLAWYICFHTDRNIAVVANKGATSQEIVKKTKEFLLGLPYFLKPGIIQLAAQSVTFENGCFIKCATTNPTSVTGSTVHILYLDEAAYIPQNMMIDFWRSVYPTMSSSNVSQIIISSTPKGRQNLFYDIYNGSIYNRNNFVNYRVDWWQVPGHDDAWAEEMKKDFGEENFEQEFGLKFDTDASRLIRAKDFKMMRRLKQTFVSHELDGVAPDFYEKIIWHPDFNPETLSFNELMHRKFVFVVDTAEGKQVDIKNANDSDYNIINIFEVLPLSIAKIKKNSVFGKKITEKDCVYYKQVGIYMDNDKDEENSAEALKALIFKVFKNGYGSEETGFIDNSRILIEMNFNGKNFLNKFMDHPNFYGALVLKTYHTKPVPGKTFEKKYGFKTTGGSHGKGYYCELGAKMIAQRRIVVSQFNDNLNLSTIGELENFSKNSKGSYEGSCVHDDIAVTVLFLSRLTDIEEFNIWLQEMFDDMNWSPEAERLRQMLKIYSEDSEKVLNDQDFSDLYLNGSNNYDARMHQNISYQNMQQISMSQMISMQLGLHQ